MCRRLIPVLHRETGIPAHVRDEKGANLRRRVLAPVGLRLFGLVHRVSSLDRFTGSHPNLRSDYAALVGVASTRTFH